MSLALLTPRKCTVLVEGSNRVSVAGTLAAAVVGGEDLGVVVGGIKTDGPLHFAVTTYRDGCKVTLLN